MSKLESRGRSLSRRQFCVATLAAGVVVAQGRGEQPGSVTGEADRAKGVSWLSEVQTPPMDLAADSRKLAPLLVDADGRPIETVAAWERRRRELLDAWRKFLGPAPAERTPLPKIEVLTEDRESGVLRQLIRYEAEPGEAVEAYLLRPLEPLVPGEAKRPGLVVLHSTVNHSIRQPAGVEGVPEKAFGLRWAKRGFVAICPRNYLWPDNHKIAAQQEAERYLRRHPSSTGMMRMLHDALLATDILVSQSDVDAARIGSIGHSLGAKEVLYHAAFDDRVRVAVSSEGGIGPTFSNWDAPWYLGPKIKQPEFRLDHHELLAATAPRAFLLLGGDSADGDISWPYIEAALPVYRLYGSPARVGLFNHKQGHAVPPVAEQRIDEWIAAYL
ncbi:MAG: dienelactone hydrolase family protein [Pirellulaceae bacterium]